MSDPAGVVNGVLIDPRSWLWEILAAHGARDGAVAGRKSEGGNARWAQVLTATGLPPGNPPHVRPVYDHFYGVRQQIGSGGPRGVVYLPTDVADNLGYYAHQILMLKDDSDDPDLLRWTYRDIGTEWGHPPYVALKPTGEVPQPPDSGSSDVEARLAVLEQDMAALKAEAVRNGENISLSSGNFYAAAGAGRDVILVPAEVNDPTAMFRVWRRGA